VNGEDEIDSTSTPLQSGLYTKRVNDSSSGSFERYYTENWLSTHSLGHGERGSDEYTGVGGHLYSTPVYEEEVDPPPPYGANDNDRRHIPSDSSTLTDVTESVRGLHNMSRSKNTTEMRSPGMDSYRRAKRQNKKASHFPVNQTMPTQRGAPKSMSATHINRSPRTMDKKREDSVGSVRHSGDFDRGYRGRNSNRHFWDPRDIVSEVYEREFSKTKRTVRKDVITHQRNIVSPLKKEDRNFHSEKDLDVKSYGSSKRWNKSAYAKNKAPLGGVNFDDDEQSTSPPQDGSSPPQDESSPNGRNKSRQEEIFSGTSGSSHPSPTAFAVVPGNNGLHRRLSQRSITKLQLKADELNSRRGSSSRASSSRASSSRASSSSKHQQSSASADDLFSASAKVAHSLTELLNISKSDEHIDSAGINQRKYDFDDNKEAVEPGYGRSDIIVNDLSIGNRFEETDRFEDMDGQFILDDLDENLATFV